MRKEFDFSKMKRMKNPYAKMLKRQITIRISNDTIDYFKELASETGITYQNLMNMYLTECAAKHKKIHYVWK
jgi:predicted DNA binding CopG/RHH family protein